MITINEDSPSHRLINLSQCTSTLITITHVFDNQLTNNEDGKDCITAVSNNSKRMLGINILTSRDLRKLSRRELGKKITKAANKKFRSNSSNY